MQRLDHAVIFGLGDQDDRLMPLTRDQHRRAVADCAIHEMGEPLPKVRETGVNHMYALMYI